jgi:hypothetical protein
LDAGKDLHPAFFHPLQAKMGNIEIDGVVELCDFGHEGGTVFGNEVGPGRAVMGFVDFAYYAGPVLERSVGGALLE